MISLVDVNEFAVIPSVWLQEGYPASKNCSNYYAFTAQQCQPRRMFLGCPSAALVHLFVLLDRYCYHDIS